MEAFKYTAEDVISKDTENTSENDSQVIEGDEDRNELSSSEMNRLQNCLRRNPKGPHWWRPARILMSLSAAVMLVGCDSSQKTHTEKSSDTPKTEAGEPKKGYYQTEIIDLVGKINPKTDYVFEESSDTKTMNSVELLPDYTFKFEEKDRAKLKAIRESALKHDLNYVTNGMSQKEIDNLYKKTLSEIDETEKNRDHLESLHFNPDNDWRLTPYISIVKELTHAKIDKVSCHIDVKEVGADIVDTETSYTDMRNGQILLSSKTLCNILDQESSNHTGVVVSFLHELTHSLRYQENKNQASDNTSVYETAFSKGEKIENYVTGEGLPEGVLKLIEKWVDDDKYYDLDLDKWKKITDKMEQKDKAESFYNSIGGTHDEEVEAIRVSALGIKYIKSHGLHFRDPSKTR
ncbi:MAG: hypothetical protein WCO09_00450 [bacterium]